MAKEGNSYSAQSYQTKAYGNNQFRLDTSSHPHIDRRTDHGTGGVKCKKETKLSFCKAEPIDIDIGRRGQKSHESNRSQGENQQQG